MTDQWEFKEATITFNMNLQAQCPMCGAHMKEGELCPDHNVPAKKGLNLAGGMNHFWGWNNDD